MLSERRIVSLIERQKLALQDKMESISHFEACEKRLEALELASEPLSALHEIAQSRATNLYSELLTSIVCDVMGDYDQSIQLSTTITRNKPSLVIESFKNGESEDLVEDRGLSVTNLVAAGLRFVALVQSNARRFVILDEPECWVERRLIPRFINVVERLCDEIGVQALVISHHSAEHIASANTHVVRVEKQQGLVRANTVIRGEDVGPSISKDTAYKAATEHVDIGLRYIRLQYFQSHCDTTIELGRGLTILTGPNETGKSAVVRAVRGLRDNQVRDALIAHNEKTATVEIGIENEMSISWSLSRKSKYGFYRFMQAGECIEESELPHQQTSPFVSSLLAMEKGDVDIHIAHQSDPLFLLNPSISGMRRAALLNLGEEQQITSTMVIKHGERIKETKAQLKAHQRTIEQSNTVLGILHGLDTLHDLYKVCHRVDKGLPLVSDAIGVLENTPDYSESFGIISALLDVIPVQVEVRQYQNAIDTLENIPASHDMALNIVEKLLCLNDDGFQDISRQYDIVVVMLRTQQEIFSLEKDITRIKEEAACPTCGQLWEDKRKHTKSIEAAIC